MFGTLNCSVQRREPLKFVETTDPAAALNRGQRLKAHISCELCRKRKVRCDGNPSGCDKCAAVSVECRYPGAENRRKRASTSRSDSEKPAARNSIGKRKCSCGNQDHTKEERHVKSPEKTSEQRQSNPAPVKDSTQLVPNPTANSDTMFNSELESGYSQQQMEQWLFSSLGDMSCSSSGLESSSIDLDADHFPDQLFIEQLEAVNSSSDEMDEGLMITEMSSGSSDVMLSNQGQSYTTFSNFHVASHPIGASKPLPPAAAAAPTTSSLSETSGKGACRCLFSTVKLLEQLQTRSANRENVAIDILLRYLREALAYCIKTVRCKQCATPSEQNMLLAMATRYMSSLCKQTVQCYLNLRKIQQEQQYQDEQSANLDPLTNTSSQELWTGATGDASERETSQAINDSPDHKTSAHEMWFSTYRIESSGERLQVLRCLVNVQLTEFGRLLEILKARAGSRVAHLVPLSQAASRTKSLRAMLQDESAHLS